MSEFEELLSKLLDQKPELSKTDIEEKIRQKKEKIGAGYLTDQGALFLIASDLGITLEKPPKVEMKIKDLYIGAKEITLDGRILNISPPREFSRKDGSTFLLRTMTVYDQDSTASVKLWDEKANLPIVEKLKPGDLVKIIKAYVKSDLNGLPTLNVGSGSDIEISSHQSSIPSIESIIRDVSSIKENERDIAISGTINGSASILEFTNSKGQPSKALRLSLKGNDENSIKVILWNKDENSIPNIVSVGAKAKLLGVKTKLGNQGIEIHGNESTIIEIDGEKEISPRLIRILSISKNETGKATILSVDKNKNMYNIIDDANLLDSFKENEIVEFIPSKIFGRTITIDKDSFVKKIDSDEKIPTLSDLRTKISDIKPNNDYCIEAIILKEPERREVQTKNGETVSLSEMFVEDDSGQIWIKGWRNQARLLDKCSLGEIISVTNVTAKAGLEGRIELFLTSSSTIKKKN